MYNLIIFLIYKIQNHNLNMAQILAHPLTEEKNDYFLEFHTMFCKG